MTEYIQYHKIKTQGSVRDNAFVYSRRNIDIKKGERIWLIAGEMIGNRHRYYLVKSFTFTAKRQKDEWVYYGGENVINKGKTIDLTDRDWFKELIEKIGRGAFGISRLPEKYVKRLNKEMGT